ncbi:MAG: response regulator transcription factor [Clostridiales bacterium]|nr:response regulator transcription factor [Clostridiales bacterium]
MVRMTIIDDDKEFGSRVSAIAREKFQMSGRQCVIRNYDSSQELLWDIEDHHLSNIYCLDIEMPKISGIALAQEIRLRDNEAYIIFLTSHNDYATEGYEYNAWRFIIKGTEQEKLPMALAAILDDMDKRKEELRYYVVENDNNLARFALNRIYYLRIEKKYTIFYTKDGEFRERKPLAQVVCDLNAPEFHYLDKSTVVNMAHITSVGENVLLSEGTELPVSRTQKQKLKRALSDYLRKRP